MFVTGRTVNINTRQYLGIYIVELGDGRCKVCCINAWVMQHFETAASVFTSQQGGRYVILERDGPSQNTIVLDDETMSSPFLPELVVRNLGRSEAYTPTCGLSTVDFKRFVVSSIVLRTFSKCDHRSLDTTPAALPRRYTLNPQIT